MGSQVSVVIASDKLINARWYGSRGSSWELLGFDELSSVCGGLLRLSLGIVGGGDQRQ
jgi:hypothetical protein